MTKPSEGRSEAKARRGCSPCARGCGGYEMNEALHVIQTMAVVVVLTAVLAIVYSSGALISAPTPTGSTSALTCASATPAASTSAVSCVPPSVTTIITVLIAR